MGFFASLRMTVRNRDFVFLFELVLLRGYFPDKRNRDRRLQAPPRSGKQYGRGK